MREHLGKSRVVTLVGPGGVGKTRVALRVLELEEQARTRPDGSWVAALEDLTAGDLLASTVGDAVGLQIPETPLALGTVADFIADRRALLLLDNCEHLYLEVGELVGRLRVACPHLTMLLTSRRPLLISGEDVITVPEMTSPDESGAVPEDPQALGHYEAVQLFVERARAGNSAFELTSANAASVVRLCNELHGNPLAIELAASRTRMFTPAEILDRLTDRFKVLNVGYQDAPDRHRSLLDCVAWSHSLCSKAEQGLWERAWVFTGGFTLDAAEEVCRPAIEAPETDDVPIVDLVGALVDQSVLVAEEGVPGGMRYRMLSDIREYGRESARAAGHETELRARHVLWCRGLAARFDAEWVGPDQGAWLARVELERANVRAALHHCAATRALVATGLLIATDLEMFWSGSGRIGEARMWFDTLFVDGGDGSPPMRARAAVAAADFAVLQGDGPSARAHVRQARELAHDYPAIRGRVLVPTAVLAIWDGRKEDAVADIDQAVTLLAGTSDISGLLTAHLMAGVVHKATGDPRGAQASFEACLALAEQHGEQFARAFALNGLGDLAAAAGDFDQAEDLYRQGLVIKHRLGDRTGMAVSLDSLGRLAIKQGRGQRAALLLGAAEGVWDTVGMSQTGNILIHTRAREPGLESVRRLLGKHDFREQFRRGSRLGIEQSIAFALDPSADTVDAESPPEDTTTSPLTKRELEVADLVADGLSNPEIAARLVISVRTAQGHVENILRKLGFNSRSLIAAWVAERRP